MRIAIQNMLLIDDPSILVVKDAMTKVAGWFVLPLFVIALIWEYFNEFKFFEVIKKLILVTVFIGAFYTIHKEGVDLSLKYSDELLKEISPRNVFLRKWSEVKVKTNEEKTSQKTGWSIVESFVVPNLNDLIGTAIFLMSKLAIWGLKLIYSTVYHLTYVFAPLTAILYFIPITKGSISGSIFSSIWCMVLPFVLVAILAIVGNSVQSSADQGDLIFSSMDQILWLFGVTLLIASTPIITIGLLKGGGVALSGAAVGALITNSASKFIGGIPGASRHIVKGGELAMDAGRFGINKLSNGFNKGHQDLRKNPESSNNFNKKYSDDMQPVGESRHKKSVDDVNDIQKGSVGNASAFKSSGLRNESSGLANRDNKSALIESGRNGTSSVGKKVTKGLSRVLSIKEPVAKTNEIQPRKFINTQKVQQQSRFENNSGAQKTKINTNDYQDKPSTRSVTKNSNQPNRNGWFKKGNNKNRSNYRRENEVRAF